MGWQATVLLDKAEKNIAQAFLVPNAYTNHLLLSNNTNENKFAFRYQTVNRFDLTQIMHEWMAGIYANR